MASQNKKNADLVEQLSSSVDKSLDSIKISMQLLIKQVGHCTLAEQQNLSGMINQSTVIIKNLADEIHTYLRIIQTHKKSRVIAFKDMINRILIANQEVIYKKDVEVSIKISETKFYHNPDFVEFILTQVLENAFNFLDDKLVHYIDVEIKSGEDSCIIEVCDNGEGLSQGVLDKLYDPFFRSSTRSSGLGMGLFLVKQMLNYYGGSIDVSSNRGVGTNFKIEIPDRSNEKHPQNG